MRVVVIGGGIFGSTAALELARRGHAVTLVDPGPLPHPDAASTDISKIIRLDYGSDVFYTELMERALPRWRQLGTPRPLFHETGFLVLSSAPLARGSFEGDSFETLSARGHALTRLDAGALARRFPSWNAARYVDGYHNPQGGWAESGAVTAWYAEEARRAGVAIRLGAAIAAVDDHGAALAGGERLGADRVVVAAGAWTTLLVPELAAEIHAVGQPVMLFSPDAPAFSPPAFVPWAADIGTSGWYGFPANADGVVKVANHGPGTPIDPRAERAVGAGEEARFRAFFADALPALAGAPLLGSRLCLYADSRDGDFWIARHPDRPRLVVATGGSGHAFKFAPVLGELCADVVEEKESEAVRRRFGWREVTPKREQARFTRTS
jgi:glycine/D-amino acid oxidase-like deaminating enzyme